MSNVRDIKSRNNTIVLSDGNTYTLRYTLNALAELEDRYGSVDAAFEAMNKNSIKAIRCVLWAGLIAEQPDLTEMQVGALIDTDTITELMGSVEQAMAGDMPTESSGQVASLPNA